MHLVQNVEEVAFGIDAHALDAEAGLRGIARPPGQVQAPRIDATSETLSRGRKVYAEHCLRCHGVGVVGSGLYPDLRFASREVHADWVIVGARGTGPRRPVYAGVGQQPHPR